MALGISLEEVLQGMNQGPLGSPVNMPEAQQPQPHHGRGQLIAGILADALAGAMGRPGPYAARMERQHDQDQEEANWGRRLEQAEQIKARYREPDVSPMERDVGAWGRMNDQQRAAYREMQGMKAGDPDVFVTLPNGQVYAGPKSGLTAALTGGGAAPDRPVGRLTPINGGQTPPASGGFPGPHYGG